MTRSPINHIVVPLAVAQTLIWAMSFYMFPAMLPTWLDALGWNKSELSGAFTVAVILTAIGAPTVGRLIDRGHGRLLLAASVLLLGIMLILLSAVTRLWQFYLVWAGIGIAMAGALYEACFAFVTRLLGSDARRGITSITLVAGFAGTVAFPGCHLLNQWIGWRGTLLVFAAVAIVVVIPLILLVPARAAQPTDHHIRAQGMQPGEALKSQVFWLLAIGFALVALNHGIIVTHLLPLLTEKGLALGTAVLAASLIGPMQVVGRVMMIGVQHRLEINAISYVSIVFMSLAAALLWAIEWWAGAVFVFVVLQGSGYGVTSITRPVITAQVLGMAHFGAISGFIAVLFMLMSAVAPSVAAALWRFGGYDLVIGFALLCCLGAISCLRSAQSRHSG